ncbi:LuxR C-terminal-related transcriptional regulator [Actinocrispum sp. NPDC049592]|uniref:LuxR C-terminal-related transcriptional regulator n=1 Tax=Actinocrispum sp. NPDC049592 TaxID=3154835 RepID=UPI0034253A4F
MRRDRLLTLLDDIGNPSGPRPVTVVSGPAGSGKTTLLAAWAADRSPARLAWLTLDDRDNDATTFWSAIWDALGDNGPATPADIAAAIGHSGVPVHLILDEADRLRDEDVLTGLETLLRQTPDNLRLVLAARTPPNLHLSRLRLEGRLLEIGLPELAFTHTEAAELFALHEVELSPDQIDEALHRTDGWPAGLRLIAMSMSDETADDRAMADYLSEEVLSAHPAHVRQFLRATSICELVSAELATALTGQADAGEILDRLDRANALVTRTTEPGGWYRYHPALRTVLLAELDRRQPLVRTNLHQIAAEWFRDAGLPLAALTHAVAADQPGLIEDLAGSCGLRLILSGHSAELHTLLNQRPVTSSAAALAAAAAALDLSDLPAADLYLSTVERDTPLHATLVQQRALLAGQAVDDAAPDPTGDDDVDTLALLNQANALIGRGDHTRAESVVQRAQKLAISNGLDNAILRCLVQLASIAGARGELSQMDTQAANAIAYATDRGWERSVPCLPAYTMRAALAYLRLDSGAARKFVTAAREMLPPKAIPPAALATLALDAIIAFDDDPPSEAAAEMVRDRWRRLTAAAMAPQLFAYVALAAQRIALTSGLIDWAVEVAQRVENDLTDTAEHFYVQAALQAHRSKPIPARKLLVPVLSGDARVAAATTPIDSWLLEAVLLSRMDDYHRAHGAIAKALALAEPLSALRPFRAAGPPVRDLLVKGAGRFGKLDRFASNALAALPAPRTGPVDQLTSREHDLLIELPSMRTTEEIADSMFVSVNTVKTHLRGIYRKLGVNHRRDAVAVARERGLL